MEINDRNKISIPRFCNDCVKIITRTSNYHDIPGGTSCISSQVKLIQINRPKFINS